MGSYRYLRGQVWFWEDPIYSDKTSDKSSRVAYNEATLRYSRYVLIIQNISCIEDTILVVPLSSNRRYTNNMTVELSHKTVVKESFTRFERIMPVNPESLSKYICTLSPDVMEEVDNHIRNLILGGGSEQFEEINKEQAVEEPVVEEDDEEVEVRPVPAIKRTLTKWTEESKKQFLKDVMVMKQEDVATKYNISVASVKKYHSKFRAELVPHVNFPKAKLKEAAPKIEMVEITPASVSGMATTIANLLTTEFRRAEVYKSISGRGISSKIKLDEFYKKLNSSIYHSIGDCFNCTYDNMGGIFDIPQEKLATNPDFIKLALLLKGNNEVQIKQIEFLSTDSFQDNLKRNMKVRCNISNGAFETLISAIK